ncbi:MAG: T9SS type A sorting domain-containing protein [Bacteroidetes bacterium]|nr:T9SS type A sorting domain-containing protein [Bacteroidota bacterium]
MKGFIFAQFPNVLISTLNQPEEVAIAINPKNTNQIVAGSNLKNAYRSNDGGVTWSYQLLACNAYDVYGDPVMIWDTANACYYIHLSNPNSAITPGGTWVDRIVIQKSGDFGQTYTTCVGVGKNGSKVQDKAWPVINPYNNEMHITWTQFDNYGSASPLDSSIILYSKSSDGGNTFTTPKRISKFPGNCIDSDSTVEGAVPAVGPLGEIYVGWVGANGLMFQKSTDGGNTWLATEQFINTFPGGWDYGINGLYRCNGLPFTFCDLSNSPYHGTIYINWSDQANGLNDGDIWIIKSTNGGATWSAPFRVNDDVPGKQQFMSAMTIDQATGYLYILFYDRRNYASGNNTDVYMAVSTNGGTSFTNYKVNANAFSPNAGYFFGDYIGISAHNNVVRPIWMQMTNNGALSVYTALVNPLTLGIEDKKKDNLNAINVAPNPFKTETTIEFSLLKEAKLTIQLVDNVGRIIKELVTEKNYFIGKNKITINATENNLKPGIYYVAFYDGEKSKFTKIVME